MPLRLQRLVVERRQVRGIGECVVLLLIHAAAHHLTHHHSLVDGLGAHHAPPALLPAVHTSSEGAERAVRHPTHRRTIGIDGVAAGAATDGEHRPPVGSKTNVARLRNVLVLALLLPKQESDRRRAVTWLEPPRAPNLTVALQGSHTFEPPCARHSCLGGGERGRGVDARLDPRSHVRDRPLGSSPDDLNDRRAEQQRAFEEMELPALLELLDGGSD